MKNYLDFPITKSEILSSLKKMKNVKSPGTDGFSAEFFKMFWIDLGDFLFKSLLLSYEKGILSHTQRQRIVTLLPKEISLKSI